MLTKFLLPIVDPLITSQFTHKTRTISKRKSPSSCSLLEASLHLSSNMMIGTSDGPNSYFQYLQIRMSMRIFYFNICECKCEYYTLIFANANANITL